MSKLKSLEELFAGRHFDREVVIFFAFFQESDETSRSCAPNDHLDGYAASHRAVREMQNADMLPKARSCGLRSI
jgi:hypothetical protein